MMKMKWYNIDELNITHDKETNTLQYNGFVFNAEKVDNELMDRFLPYVRFKNPNMCWRDYLIDNAEMYLDDCISNFLALLNS